MLGKVHGLVSVQGGDRYFSFMQGSDFAIKKKSEISQFFIVHDGLEFIHFDPKWYDFGKYKINYHHFWLTTDFIRKSNLLKAISHGIAKTEQKINWSRNDIDIFRIGIVFDYK